MNIAESVMQIYPNISLEDFEVTDNGSGQVLHWFTNVYTQPTQQELDDAWIIVNSQQQKQSDILEFVSKYRIVETINKHIECCTSNAAKQGCTQENKDLIDLQKADLNTKLAPAETDRDDKLSYLKATYTNEEVDIISEVNDYLINN